MGDETTAPTARAPRVRATPRARRALRDKGMDASRILGSGPGGRVVESDVQKYSHGDDVQVPFGGMRRTIARRLLISKVTIPHFYVRQTINAAPLAGEYALSKAKFPCSLNDLVLHAVARAVAEFPAFRRRLDGEDLFESPHAHIGMAVGLADGLVVPAILDADRLSLRDLALETRRVAELARVRKIENMGKSVFTVSNLGMYGTDEFTAIINPPESAILAVGAIREQAMANKGVLYAGKAMTLTLSCDHRIIDGVCAAQFMARLKQILESLGQP